MGVINCLSLGEGGRLRPNAAAQEGQTCPSSRPHPGRDGAGFEE